MAALTLFPLQYKRQDSVPIDIDMVFSTTADRVAYLTSARRYAGMLVTDLEEDTAYLLNSARDAWIPIGAGGAGGGGFIFQVGAPSLGHFHTAALSNDDAVLMIRGQNLSFPPLDIANQPFQVLTTDQHGAPSHSHDITVMFDYEMHTFIVTEVTANTTDQHFGHLVGDGPVRYNPVRDCIEYRASEEANTWVDIATPKVRTKTSHYTLRVTDNQYVFRMDSATPCNLIIPNDASADIPIGTTAVLSMNGTGSASFVPSVGVNIDTPSSLTIAMRYGKASITKTGPNQWEVEGNVGGTTTISASGAPMGGFKAFTSTPAVIGNTGIIDVGFSSAFISGNGYWYGLMDPDNPPTDWDHVKVIGGQITLNSIGSFLITVNADISIPDNAITTADSNTCLSVMLTDGLNNVISVGSLNRLQRAAGDGVLTPPLSGVTLTGWVNNDGVSGPFGSNQTVKVRVFNPYAENIELRSIDVCFWYADTRQPRQFAVTTPVVPVIGWLSTVDDSSGTPLHANTGSLGSTAQDFPSSLHAGIVGYTSGTVIWSSTWTPSDGDSAPVLVPLTNGKVQVDWPYLGGPPWARASGILTLTATLNGIPVATGQKIVAVADNAFYTLVTWGPEV